MKFKAVRKTLLGSRTHLRPACRFTLLIASSLLALQSVAAQELVPTEVVPGEFIVKYKKSVSATARVSMTARLGAQSVQALSTIGAEVVQATHSSGIDHAYAKRLLASGAVDYIEPNFVYRIDRTPNDAQFSQLWGMHNSGQTGGTADADIDAPEAWDITTGSSDVVVGVVDTGVNYHHPDLQQNMWRNPGEIPSNNIDDDHNGVIDDVYGYNAIANNGNPADDHSHGSHCAGTIAGVADNGAGVAGVSWNAKIMALKFLDSSGSGSTDNAVEAIEYAINQKARGVNIRVLSNSWGGGGESQALSDAISAAESAGILFVAAAGNASSDNDSDATYPSNYPQANVLAVAAIDSDGNLASFSNYGATTVDVAAPGVGIISTVLGSAYASYSGTSMATPHVSGIAALLIGQEPGLSASQMRTRIMSTVKPLSTLTGTIVSGGVASAKNALTNTVAPSLTAQAQPRYAKRAIPGSDDSQLGSQLLNADDGMADLSLPFSFPYYKTDFTRLAISANGRVIPLRADDPLPSAYDYSNKLWAGINVYNDDLYPSPHSSQPGVWARVESDRVLITWNVVPYGLRASPDSRVSMKIQAVLKASGTIDIQYGDTDSGDSATAYGASATVGLAPVSGTTGLKLQVLHNTSMPDTVGSGRGLSFELAQNRKHDFDGDGIGDLILWRPSSGQWFALLSSTNFDTSQIRSFRLGTRKDVPLTGDFDGDGKVDFAVYRPSKFRWFLLKSSTGYGRVTQISWGAKGDLPVTGDFDGDGVTDITVYTPSKGRFAVLRASMGFNAKKALKTKLKANLMVKSGGRGSKPMSGDFLGNGADAFVTVSDSDRVWTVKDSSGRQLRSAQFGAAGDKRLVCDYDQNGIADLVSVRASGDGSLGWYVATDSGASAETSFGAVSRNDIPLCGSDYDGDGFADLTTFGQSNGEWNIRRSSDSAVRTIGFGQSGDIAL